MSTTPQPGGMPPGPMPPAGNVYYYPPPPPPRRGFWGRLFLSLFLFMIGPRSFLNIIFLFTGASLLDAGTVRVQEKYISHNEYAKDKVVILPIEGIITGKRGRFHQAGDRHGQEDDNVKAMVLRVDSPGGSVSGSDYIYHHLCELAEKQEEDPHRRQHGQHRGQRRLLCLDGRRPQARHDLRRANLLHRLDRRDHARTTTWPNSWTSTAWRTIRSPASR